MPVISVIVPVYKVEPYLRRCVDSILNQTFRDFELILVDDGSPDNCGAICDAYAQQDPRVRVIHQANGGLSAARNAGIDWVFAHSDSRWMTFIDSDDWVHRNYLQYLFDAVRRTGTLCAVAGYRSVKNGEEVIDHAFGATEVLVTPDELHDRTRKIADVEIMRISACGKLFSAGLLKEIRFPAGKIHEDRFVTYKLHFLCQQMAVVPVVLYYYYQSLNSITRSKWTPSRLVDFEAIREQRRFFKKHKAAGAYQTSLYDEYRVARLQCIDIRASEFKQSKKHLRFLRTRLVRMCLLHPGALRLTWEQKREVIFLVSPFMKRVIRHFERRFGWRQ